MDSSNIHGINLKPFIPSIIIMIVSVILILTDSTSLVVECVRYVLSFSRELIKIFWVIAIVCCFSYYFTTRRTDVGGKELFIHALGPIPDSILSTVTYGMIFRITITMLRGVFKQYFYEYIFIRDINYVDLPMIAILMLCLLFWSISQVYKLGAVAYIYSKRGEQIRATKKQSKEDRKHK